MPNKRTRQTPRKSSTNTRALSTRITNLQKEMNPYATITGMPLGSNQTKSTMIDKVYTQVIPLGNDVSSKDLKCSDLDGFIPDGAKILSMKITNLTGRYVAVTVPSGSGLMLTQDQFTAAPLPALSRFNVAPLSRFPVVRVNIPDLLAKPIDVGATTTGLFSVNAGVTGCSLLIRYHVKIAI